MFIKKFGPLLSWTQFVIICCFVFTSGASADSDMLSVEIDGATLNYIDEGSGDPIVLVHGHISDKRVWTKSIDVLSKSYRVIAYTQRYYGNTPWQDNGENFTRETHVNDLIKFVEQLDLDKPVTLITRSYGGYVGLHAINQRPSLFKSAIHFEPAIADHIQEFPGYEHAWREITNGMPAVIAALESGNDASAALRFLEVVYRMPTHSAKLKLPDTLTAIVEENGKTVAPFFRMDALPPLSCETLNSISIPQLIVIGENTHVWFAMAAEALEKCSPNIKLATIKGVNHDGAAKKSQEFLGLAENFMKSLQ